MVPETCTYYTRVAFGMLRCQGATLAGKCAHHKYVGSYRVITGTPEEIYDELFDAMQALRQQAGELK
jgi:hypothetical protein